MRQSPLVVRDREAVGRLLDGGDGVGHGIADVGGLQHGQVVFIIPDRHHRMYRRKQTAQLPDGIALAAEIIDSGKALETLDKLIKVSNRPEEE